MELFIVQNQEVSFFALKLYQILIFDCPLVEEFSLRSYRAINYALS